MVKNSQNTILIVDDIPKNLKMLFLALEHQGFTVLTAEDGPTGINLAEKTLPDLILLDIMMPDMDGYETCLQLKANKITRQIPVIFMTALSDVQAKVKAFEAGGSDYVSRPFEIAEVLARIKTHLTIHQLQNDLREQNRQLLEENEKRRRVQDALRESRQRYRLLANNSTDVIAEQGLDYTYRYVSPACETVLGYKIEEMIGTSEYDYIHPEDVQAVKAARQKVSKCGSVVTVTYRGLQKEGGYCWLETISRLVCDPTTGLPDEIVSVSRDVTKRVQLTEMLREHNNELDAFAHTVAHDLKTPLTTIISYVDFLLGYSDRVDSKKNSTLIKQIRETCQKGLNIIDELLLLASVRKEDIEMKPLDMARLVDNALERLHLMVENSEANITLPQSWPETTGYGPWIEEIWINYITNAIKYSGTPPVVELGATVLDNNTVKCWVKDNGEGLSDEDQAGLFAEFVRLDEVRVEGHGLGLSIVKRIVEKLGGTVGVESQIGKGSLFYFTLPQVPANNT